MGYMSPNISAYIYMIIGRDSAAAIGAAHIGDSTPSPSNCGSDVGPCSRHIQILHKKHQTAKSCFLFD